MLTFLGLLAVVVLIAANGYFVAGEFAFVTARRSRFTEAAAAGDRRSKRAVQVLQRLSFMLSGAQLGITVTSLVLGFLAQPVIADLLEPVLDAVAVPDSAQAGIAILIAFVLATFAQMVFGELAPKNLAIAKPEAVARALAPTTLWYTRVTGPVIRLFDGSANRLLRLLRIEPVQELHSSVSADELDLIVDSSAESGHLTPLQAALLERALDFAELEASDAMVAWNRVVTLDLDSTAADLRDAMDTRHSRFPVVDSEGAVQGIVHAKDLLGVSRSAYQTTLVAEFMRPEFLAVPEAAGLNVVLAGLRAYSTEMAVVIDEYGGPAGVVTLEDVVEELVGDIEDEYDPSDPHDHVETAPGVWMLDATTRPDEIERITGFVLPEGEYDTVAGLVLDRLEHIPATGECVVVDGVRIEVVALDGLAISRVELRLAPEQNDQTEAGGSESRNETSAHESTSGKESGAATGDADTAGEAPLGEGERS